MKKENKQSKLINLIRERRKYEVRTLDGYVPTANPMYNILSKEIEIEMEKINSQNKSSMLKEMREAGIIKGSFEERVKKFQNEKRNI